MRLNSAVIKSPQIVRFGPTCGAMLAKAIVVLHQTLKCLSFDKPYCANYTLKQWFKPVISWLMRNSLEHMTKSCVLQRRTRVWIVYSLPEHLSGLSHHVIKCTIQNFHEKVSFVLFQRKGVVIQTNVRSHHNASS